MNGTGVTSPLLKRKQAEAANGAMAAQKRRREGDDTDYDGELGAGSKHWTDEEKSKLFTWLMGQGNDEHWNALRATKNSCLRDVGLCQFTSAFPSHMTLSAQAMSSVARRRIRR